MRLLGWLLLLIGLGWAALSSPQLTDGTAAGQAALGMAVLLYGGFFVLPGLVLTGIGGLLARRRGRRPASDRLPCPYCAEPIRPAARRCPHCRTDLDASPTPADQAPHTEISRLMAQPQDQERRGRLLLGLALLGLLGGCATSVSGVRAEPPTRTEVLPGSYRTLATCTLEGLKIARPDLLYQLSDDTSTAIIDGRVSGQGALLSLSFTQIAPNRVQIQSRLAKVLGLRVTRYAEAAWPVVQRCAAR